MEIMGGAQQSRNIAPGEPAWYLDGTDFIMASSVAVDETTCAFAGIPHGFDFDYHDPFSAKTRFYRYREGSLWSCSEIAARIESLIRHRASNWKSDGLILLDEGGRIWFLGDDAWETRVNHADAYLLSTIRMFGDTLYAAGYGGQLYRRIGETWSHDDAGMLGVMPKLLRLSTRDSSNFSIRDLVIGDESYACGTADYQPALFWRPQGGQWTGLALDPALTGYKAGVLEAIHIESSESIWIVTDHGLLLRGNGRSGFKIATKVCRTLQGTPVEFNSIARFRGDLYVGGEQVCKLIQDGSFERQVGPPVAPLNHPDDLSPIVGGRLSVVGDVMWAIDFGILSRFDGKSWSRIVMPTVYHNV